MCFQLAFLTLYDITGLFHYYTTGTIVLCLISSFHGRLWGNFPHCYTTLVILLLNIMSKHKSFYLLTPQNKQRLKQCGAVVEMDLSETKSRKLGSTFWGVEDPSQRFLDPYSRKDVFAITDSHWVFMITRWQWKIWALSEVGSGEEASQNVVVNCKLICVD